MRPLGALAVMSAATGAAACVEIPELQRADCSPEAAFVAVAPVDGIDGDPGIESAQLSRDERSIVFSRSTVLRSASGDPIQRYGDLYLASRADRGAPFGEARALDELNSEFDELTGSLSDDLQTLYFDRQDRGQRYQIFAATRPAPEAAFGAPTAIRLGDDATSDFEPFITADHLYFGSTRVNGLASLFAAVGAGTQFGAPQWLRSLQTLNSPAAYEAPVVTRDGLTIYFAAPLDGRLDKDIWIATRASRYDPFDAPRPVDSVNTTGRDTPAWISDDGCRLYYITGTGRPALRIASRRAS
jgi:hypothetical protein